MQIERSRLYRPTKAPSKFKLDFKVWSPPPIHFIDFVLAKKTLHRVANGEY
jgi:hypothetical protein